MAINIQLNQFIGAKGVRLRIYTGVYGTDLLAYDSNSPLLSKFSSIKAPCGKAVIILENNNSASVVYGMDLDYELDLLDFVGQQWSCANYSKYFDDVLMLLRTIVCCICRTQFTSCGGEKESLHCNILHRRCYCRCCHFISPYPFVISSTVPFDLMVTRLSRTNS